MAEAIHCPSCSTRYRLRPERLKPFLRRARCFSCGEVFPLHDAAPLPPPEAPAATASYDLADIAAALEPVPAAHLEEAPPAPSSLTLGDLESTDAEILEKTLSGLSTSLPGIPGEAAPIEATPVAVAPFAAPSVAPVAPDAAVPEVGEDTLTGTYSSARDAISKLFAGMPEVPSASKAPKESGPTDMEATLSALEATLGKGGATPPGLPPRSDGDEPTFTGHLPETLQAPSTATMRLSQEDLMAALRTGAPSQPTEALRPSDLLSPLPAPPSPAPSPVQATEPAPAEDTGAERLRLKIGEEIYPSLTMAQLAAWIEEGRILEHHLVARQHSENWLEAHKVPGLRPIFERLRRERGDAGSSFDSPILEIAPKKSLFGGLFGKN
ncbi:zinc-ribbon domain-containing protein [Geothrix fuzhouensis]|uniref:zinc-ribbon domain-containing protein n=1 Tax=Geothrix fuzhouensis TaxID=2966451 RepID=UPI0021498E6A